MFGVAECFFKDKNKFLKNIIACVTDDKPAMVGCKHDILSFLRKFATGAFNLSDAQLLFPLGKINF